MGGSSFFMVSERDSNQKIKTCTEMALEAGLPC